MSGRGGSCYSNFSSSFSSESVGRAVPVSKLIRPDPTRTPVVLLACGSFNPPTIMHLRMFDLAADQATQDGYQVIGQYISPVNDAYGKQDLLPAKIRLQLLQACADDSACLMVDDWEASQPKAQRTLIVLHRVKRAVLSHLDALSHLYGQASKASECEVKLLCGSDLLESMLTPGAWIPNQISSLLQDFGIMCISRDMMDLSIRIAADPVMGEHVHQICVIEDPWQNNLSSSLVRQLAQEGKSIRYLVPDRVLEFIKAHNLYQPGEKQALA